MVCSDYQARLAHVCRMRLDPAGGVGDAVMDTEADMVGLIVALALTFFPGQSNWYELDTSGVEWTVHHIVSTEETQ